MFTIDLHQWSMLNFISMKQYSFLMALSVSMIIVAMVFMEKGNEQPDKHGWLLPAFIPVVFAGLYFARRQNRISESKELIEEKVDESPSGEPESVPAVTDHKKLGNFVFIESKGILSLNDETFELSVKERKALSILMSNQNEVVGRDLLIQNDRVSRGATKPGLMS